MAAQPPQQHANVLGNPQEVESGAPLTTEEEPVGLEKFVQRSFEKRVLHPVILFMLLCLGLRMGLDHQEAGVSVFSLLFLFFLLVFLVEIPLRLRYGTKEQKRWLLFCGPVTALTCLPGLGGLFAGGGEDLRAMTFLRVLRLLGLFWVLRSADLWLSGHKTAMRMRASAVLRNLLAIPGAILVAYALAIVLTALHTGNENPEEHPHRTVPLAMLQTLVPVGVPTFVVHAAILHQRSRAREADALQAEDNTQSRWVVC